MVGLECYKFLDILSDPLHQSLPVIWTFLQNVSFYGLRTSKKFGFQDNLQGGQMSYKLVGAQNKYIIVLFYGIESLMVVFLLVPQKIIKIWLQRLKFETFSKIKFREKSS